MLFKVLNIFHSKLFRRTKYQEDNILFFFFSEWEITTNQVGQILQPWLQPTLTSAILHKSDTPRAPQDCLWLQALGEGSPLALWVETLIQSCLAWCHLQSLHSFLWCNDNKIMIITDKWMVHFTEEGPVWSHTCCKMQGSCQFNHDSKLIRPQPLVDLTTAYSQFNHSIVDATIWSQNIFDVIFFIVLGWPAQVDLSLISLFVCVCV